MSRSTVVPKCLAVIVCETVVEDVQSRNKSVFNIFNIIQAFEFPVTHDRLSVLVSLTDGRGQVPFVLEFGKDGEPKPAFELKGSVKLDSPLTVVDLVFNMRSVPIPEAGHYAVHVFAHGTLIGERRIEVIQIDAQPGS